MTGILKGLSSGLVLVLCLVWSRAFGETPKEQIQETIQQVIAAMNGTPNGRAEERQAMLRDVLMPRFDWVSMAKHALGKYWNSVPDRQQEFVAAFAAFLGNSYVGKIGVYKDEKIVFLNESVEKNLAQVNTKIVSSNGEPTSVNYRLHRVQGEWKIFDVVVEDISIVGNYRSQFSRILAHGSFDDLLLRLKEKEANNRQ